jgi:hypothetical protein
VTYCCAMRQKYLLGIVREDPSLPTPSDALDFMDFDRKAADGRPLIRIKYCPFCGKQVQGPLRTT